MSHLFCASESASTFSALHIAVTHACWRPGFKTVCSMACPLASLLCQSQYCGWCRKVSWSIELLVHYSAKTSNCTSGLINVKCGSHEFWVEQGASRQGVLLRGAGQDCRGLYAHGPHHSGSPQQAERSPHDQAELLAAPSCGLSCLQLPPLPGTAGKASCSHASSNRHQWCQN